MAKKSKESSREGLLFTHFQEPSAGVPTPTELLSLNLDLQIRKLSPKISRRQNEGAEYIEWGQAADKLDFAASKLANGHEASLIQQAYALYLIRHLVVEKAMIKGREQGKNPEEVIEEYYDKGQQYIDAMKQVSKIKASGDKKSIYLNAMDTLDKYKAMSSKDKVSALKSLNKQMQAYLPEEKKERKGKRL